MAFTISFPTAAEVPDVETFSSWLTEQGEPFEQEGATTLALRALPVRFLLATGSPRASVEISPSTPLTRLVGLIFDLSMRLGADVHLQGRGDVRRPELWLALADDQDRLRIASALDKATAHHIRDEVLTGFWSLLVGLGNGRDLRWEFQQRAIVEVRDVALDEAAEDLSTTDTGAHASLLIAISEPLHVLAWRWLAEAYPSLVST